MCQTIFGPPYCNFNGKRAPQKNILRKVLSNGPSANLRPLYNSNVAKVSIVKWSQILISIVRSSILGIPKIPQFNSFKKKDFKQEKSKSETASGRVLFRFPMVSNIEPSYSLTLNCIKGRSV